MKKNLKQATILAALVVVMMTTIQAKRITEISLQADSDPALELEEWMVQDNYWTTNYVVAPQEVDAELDLEQWMVDDCFGNRFVGVTFDE